MKENTLAARTTTPDALLKRLSHARRQTDRLFALISPEARYARPIPERHRIVFYLGHLEAFDWNLLQRSLPGLTPFDTSLDRLFAFGIDPVGNNGLPSDRPSDWPTYASVQNYASRIRQNLDAALENADEPLLLNVAIEHRLMHAETLAYMLHQLPYSQKLPQPQTVVTATKTPDFGMIEIPAGDVTLGLSRDSGAFGWDNEFQAHRVHVPSFLIDRYKVTNAQYLEFVNAGGYQARELWTEPAWAWKEEHGIEHPVFWKRASDRWLYRGMFEEMPLPPYAPVYLSHAEASAYCTWSGKRLPSEAEWHRACYETGNAFPWGEAQPVQKHGYFDFERWGPSPVNAFPAATGSSGIEGALANGWEWTATPFAPFPGFTPFPFYAGYSADFFDGMHYVMKGGSPRTASSMLRSSFRNWFQPHYQYVYAGFRCAK